jgi:signal transduction histidine kinase
MSRDLIRQMPILAQLSEQDIDRLYQMAEPLNVASGEWLIREGELADSLYLILDGEFQITKRAGPQDVPVLTRRTGEMLGEMSLLEQGTRSASVRALRDSRVLRIGKEAFGQVLAFSPSAALTVLNTVFTRLQSTESMVMQHEKMAALGTLAAGLAHELNNPAAAVRRSAAQLRDALANWQHWTARLDWLALNPDQLKAVELLRQEIVRRAGSPAQYDPITSGDREGDLQAWLEGRGIEQAWELASGIVAFGWDVNAMEELSQSFAGEQVTVIAHWLNCGYTVHLLINEVIQSAERISDIVRSVKTYSHLDQSPLQDVDVHESLESTLVILKHRLGPGIRVTREYAPDLPRVEAFASEINQVWTNIIDNAIDAMRGEGKLLLKTYIKDGLVVVEIADSGPGIPPEIESRVFEPFFTTRPQGVGTGLGLHIVYNIVVYRHGGQIDFTSRPGRTCFQVMLPVKMSKK